MSHLPPLPSQSAGNQTTGSWLLAPGIQGQELWDSPEAHAWGGLGLGEAEAGARVEGGGVNFQVPWHPHLLFLEDRAPQPTPSPGTAGPETDWRRTECVALSRGLGTLLYQER